MRLVSRVLAVTGLALLVAAAPAGAATFEVDTTSDTSLTACTAAAGDCSLRGAITQANAAGDDLITFEIGGAAPHVILLGADLPAVTDDGTTIDGYSDTG